MKNFFRRLLSSNSNQQPISNTERVVLEYFGNVGPDLRGVQSSTGRLYPPNLARTQPGEYGLRTRSGKPFQEALSRLTSDMSTVWAGSVKVLITGTENSPSLEIRNGDVALGVVAATMLREHPEVLQAALDGKKFRGATEDGMGGINLRIFFRV